MKEREALERLIGAVLAPEVRVAGTIAGAAAVVPAEDYLRRFPPAMVVAFGRTPSGAGDPREQLRAVNESCARAGREAPLVACDLEQGAGLHFARASRLPPALAMASAALACSNEREGLDWLLRAGELTAREAREHGVGLVLAPVADVNTQRDNPIVAVRSFGDEPHAAAQRACAFLLGLHAGGVLGCAKHFPGHGDSRVDSHIELARIERSEQELDELELAPFRELIRHGVDTCMVGHLDVPALTAAPGLPATFSRAAIAGTLRTRLRFGGAVLTDAMNMGALAQFERRHTRALLAGCDVLLCPSDPLAAAQELLQSIADGSLPRERLEAAAERALAARSSASRLAARTPSIWPAALDATFVDALAARSLRWLGPPWREFGSALEVGLRTPARVGPEFEAAWRDAIPAPGAARADGRTTRLAVAVLEMGAWRGSYGLSVDEERELRAELERALAEGRPATLIWFGSPQVLPVWAVSEPRLSVLVAFAPTPVQVRAVARVLRSDSTGSSAAAGSGSLPTRLG